MFKVQNIFIESKTWQQFGIIAHENVNPNGRKSYQVKRFQVKGKVKVKMRTSETSGEVLILIKGEMDPFGSLQVRFHFLHFPLIDAMLIFTF